MYLLSGRGRLLHLLSARGCQSLRSRLQIPLVRLSNDVISLIAVTICELKAAMSFITYLIRFNNVINTQLMSLKVVFDNTIL